MFVFVPIVAAADTKREGLTIEANLGLVGRLVVASTSVSPQGDYTTSVQRTVLPAALDFYPDADLFNIAANHGTVTGFAFLFGYQRL